MVRPFDDVHKGPHEQYPAPAGFQQIFRIGRVRDLIDGEPGAVVPNSYLYPVARAGERYFDVLAGIELISVLHSVGDGFTDRKIDGRDEIVTQSLGLHELVRLNGSFIDRFDAARQFKFLYLCHSVCIVR